MRWGFKWWTADGKSMADVYDLGPKPGVLERWGGNPPRMWSETLKTRKEESTASLLTALVSAFVGERTAAFWRRRRGLDKIASAGLDELQAGRRGGAQVALSISGFFLSLATGKVGERCAPRASVSPANRRGQGRAAPVSRGIDRGTLSQSVASRPRPSGLIEAAGRKVSGG